MRSTVQYKVVQHEGTVPFPGKLESVSSWLPCDYPASGAWHCTFCLLRRPGSFPDFPNCISELPNLPSIKTFSFIFIWRDCIHPVYTNQLYRKVMKWQQLDCRSKLKMTATSQNPPFDLKMLRDGFDRCISRIVFCINICSGLVRGGQYALF